MKWYFINIITGGIDTFAFRTRANIRDVGAEVFLKYRCTCPVLSPFEFCLGRKTFTAVVFTSIFCEQSVLPPPPPIPCAPRLMQTTARRLQDTGLAIIFFVGERDFCVGFNWCYFFRCTGSLFFFFYYLQNSIRAPGIRGSSFGIHHLP